MAPVMYKNRLQEYTQKSAILLPVYETSNEGSSHDPRFRSTVYVDGSHYNSPNTFSNRKEAEQDVARIALESIDQKPKDESFPFLSQDTSLCKSIMNEYAVKMHFDIPTYVTKQEMGPVPVFVSDILLNDVVYTGQRAKNKKESERLAAQAAILSIMDSESKMVMSGIIKSKEKFYALLLADDVNQSGVGNNVADNGGNHSGNEMSCSKRKEVDSPAAIATINSSNFGSSALAQPFHEFKKPKVDPSSEVLNSEVIPHPIIFVPPGVPCSSSGQKKNRKKKKSPIVVDARMSDPAVPLGQDPPVQLSNDEQGEVFSG